MGQVLSIQKPVEKLVLEIRAHVHDAGRAENTCAKHQLQAGLRLIELRTRVEAGEAGEVDWWSWYETQFTGHIKSRSYAEKLMRWARTDDPDATIDAERTRAREGMRAHRKAVARNVTRTEEQASDDDIDDADIEADVEPENYRTAYLLRADQARRFASYSGPVNKELIAMARNVATAWENLAKQMEKSL